MQDSFKIFAGNFLFKYFFPLYKIAYPAIKRKQDKREIDFIKRYVKLGHTVLDIGANIGFYTTLLSDIVGEKGKVIGFEPDLINFKHLQDATRSRQNIIINNLAIGAKTETIKIYTSKRINVDHRTYKPDAYDKELDVSAISIDEYLMSDTKVDFIKIDIQGFEMQAIKGMEKILLLNSEIKIVSELWPYGLMKAGSSSTEYFKYLEYLGFELQLLKEARLQPLSIEDVKKLESLGEEHYFNIFASRKSGQLSKSTG